MIKRQVAIEAEPRAEPRKDALVAAAYTVLATRGFEGLRTREVAAMVGVNIATLHYYFPHKEDLIRGVVAYAMGRFRGTLGGAGSAEDQLRAHFRGLRRLSRDEPELFAVMAELAIRGVRDTSLRRIVGGTDDAWRAMLRTLLRRAQDEGALRADLDPEGMAAVIVATLKGTFMLPASEPENVERTFRQLEMLVGLRAKRSPAARGRAKRSSFNL
ncbi:MAG: TetR/AcrR family transcriptional regulator [Chloroflexi bacterium]|nr:MAG: TetR/AcrR family transcriptional regulator [Chloroflexota bacterium]TMF59309.1 MAG: TetR/AcrR family transcriptional regulator [Chloroflexota bacterium]